MWTFIIDINLIWLIILIIYMMKIAYLVVINAEILQTNSSNTLWSLWCARSRSWRSSSSLSSQWAGLRESAEGTSWLPLIVECCIWSLWCAPALWAHSLSSLEWAGLRESAEGTSWLPLIVKCHRSSASSAQHMHVIKHQLKWNKTWHTWVKIVLAGQNSV